MWKVRADGKVALTPFIKRLAELELIERRKDALVSVAWDVVRAEMRLAA